MGICYSCVDNASVEVIERVSWHWAHCCEEPRNLLTCHCIVRKQKRLPGTAQDVWRYLGDRH